MKRFGFGRLFLRVFLLSLLGTVHGEDFGQEPDCRSIKFCPECTRSGCYWVIFLDFTEGCYKSLRGLRNVLSWIPPGGNCGKPECLDPSRWDLIGFAQLFGGVVGGLIPGLCCGYVCYKCRADRAGYREIGGDDRTWWELIRAFFRGFLDVFLRRQDREPFLRDQGNLNGIPNPFYGINAPGANRPGGQQGDQRDQENLPVVRDAGEQVRNADVGRPGARADAAGLNQQQQLQPEGNEEGRQEAVDPGLGVGQVDATRLKQERVSGEGLRHRGSPVRESQESGSQQRGPADQVAVGMQFGSTGAAAEESGIAEVSPPPSFFEEPIAARIGTRAAGQTSRKKVKEIYDYEDKEDAEVENEMERVD